MGDDVHPPGAGVGEHRVHEGAQVGHVGVGAVREAGRLVGVAIKSH